MLRLYLIDKSKDKHMKNEKKNDQCEKFYTD